MLNYTRTICQLRLVHFGKYSLNLVLLVLLSCSSTQAPEPLRPIDALPQWMKLPAANALLDQDGNFIAHPFFDLAPFAHQEDLSLNFYPVTPAGSKFSYQLHLLSGQLIRHKRFCALNDVWGKYTSTLDFPPYTTGIVPRVLDQSGLPQEIKVFGRPDFYLNLERRDVASYRVRIVGGIVHQSCKRHPCNGKNDWRGKLLLIGVDSLDSNLEQVKTLEELKKKVDWKKVIAFMQNENGRFVSEREQVPGFRTLGEVGSTRAFANALSKGKVFDFDEMKTLRNACLKLYDTVWEDAIATRESLSSQDGSKELEDFKNRLESTNFITLERTETTRKDIVTRNFASFFKDFSKNYMTQFHVCSRYVRPANLQVDADRHWFFVFMSLFVEMEKNGYIYLCKKRAWMENPLRNTNEYTYDPDEERRACRDKDLDHAFSSAILNLEGMAQFKLDHFKYLDYDSTYGGTHNKINWWVPVSGKMMGCNSKAEDEAPNPQEIFPSNVEWNDFGNLATKDTF